MRVKLGLAVLLLSVLFWAPGGPVAQLAAQQRLASLEESLLQPASMTVPEAPIVVDTAGAVNGRGWTGSAATASSEDLTGDVLAAYTLAVAVSPTACRLTTPLLAAIGQVESGNLAGHTLSAHRASPEILGPVLDGKKYHAVEDTDAGRWDHDQVWDRALGPMQIIPASWRVVGLDMDGDGVRDPQNIYDAAGAAMVYLCAEDRDLGTSDGLREAILSYNDSQDYLRAVLAWKAVFDQADLTGLGAVPFVSALAMPSSTPMSLGPSPATRTPAAVSSDASVPARPSTPAASPSSAGSPTGSAPTPSPRGPSTPSSPTPDPVDQTPLAGPSSSPGDPSTGPTPPPVPAESGPSTPAPGPTPPPELPECPVPADEPADPAAEEPADEPVVSPETCTPPEGYTFDPETDELIALPPASPAP